MARKLKVDFHTHTAEDPHDHIPYNAIQLVDLASRKGFDALAITNHNEVLYTPELVDYAGQRGILLIPGMEAAFSNRHVVILNPDFEKNPLGRPLDDLAEIKNDHNLIIAPHPFHPRFKSLNSELFRYLAYFDAIEFSNCYHHFINLNKKAEQAARDHGKPLVGSSDCHSFWQFGSTYSLVESEKDSLSIIEAVKRGKVEVRSSPLSLLAMGRILATFILRKIFFGRKQEY